MMKYKYLFHVLLITLVTIQQAWSQNSRETEQILTTDAQKSKLATFENAKQLKWAVLEPGVNCYGTTDRYVWEVVPKSLNGVRFLVLPHHSGVLSFKVQTDGLVFMATSTRWNGGGNSSGDWKDEVIEEKDLKRKGWRKLRTFRKLSNTDTGKMAVFYRFCKTGEIHSIRTEKYAAPMLLIR